MGKAFKAKDKKHYINKRVTVLVNAQAIFNYVSWNVYDKPSRTEIESSAAHDVYTEYTHDHGIDSFSSEEDKESFILEISDAYDYCVKKFPDIPEYEFKHEKMCYL